MRIGVDFDNTIVCYDALFHKVALEQELIPPDLPVNKSEVRNHLRKTGREPIWTEMQGYVYGARMSEAAPFPGVIEFFQDCRRANVPVSIISHKTRRPFIGEKHDLHQAALRWLELQGFFDPTKVGLPRDEVYFELTKEAKLERIAERGCVRFIDDLPELLGEPAFPKIERILFDPANIYTEESRFTRIQSWGQFSDSLRVERFAIHQGFNPPEIEPMSGGGNNRVFRISLGLRRAVLKHYFSHRADMRDRFAAERAFYAYIWSHGVRRTPEPLAWHADYRLALFSFIEGQKLRSTEVNNAAVSQAADFIVEINRDRNEAKDIPSASEACFSLLDHLSVVDNRLVRLQQIEPTCATDLHALEFVSNSLQPAWLRCRQKLLTQGDWAAERILSPSDFGFHNAIVNKDGKLRFFDFEYAGWDDPAKLICDFFCQPQIPTPRKYWDSFANSLLNGLGLDPVLRDRARALLPAYQIKWCCIMLNEFARHDRERRDFAQGAASATQRKVEQLAKARAAFQAILI